MTVRSRERKTGLEAEEPAAQAMRARQVLQRQNAYGLMAASTVPLVPGAHPLESPMNDSIHDPYHRGSRRLQEQFDCVRIADRLANVTYHAEFTDSDRSFIESQPMFFLATADAAGSPDCSFKGGLPGFVRVVGSNELAFPDYNGNGQFRSLGNIGINPHVGLLFIDWERPRRLRVNGTARVNAEDPLIGSWPGAQLVTRVTALQIFPNCPRYLPTMKLVEHSTYAPRANYEPPRPGWKDDPRFRDALPEKDLRP